MQAGVPGCCKPAVCIMKTPVRNLPTAGERTWQLGGNVRKADIREEADGVLGHGKERVLCDHAYVTMRRVAHAKAHPDASAD